jgi:hypothetical protein
MGHRASVAPGGPQRTVSLTSFLQPSLLLKEEHYSWAGVRVGGAATHLRAVTQAGLVAFGPAGKKGGNVRNTLTQQSPLPSSERPWGRTDC